MKKYPTKFSMIYTEYCKAAGLKDITEEMEIKLEHDFINDYMNEKPGEVIRFFSVPQDDKDSIEKIKNGDYKIYSEGKKKYSDSFTLILDLVLEV